ncbi:MAG: AMP-binding protein [Candidatus Pacearchaeota archaeon]|jgi:acetyl-CoA synthetase
MTAIWDKYKDELIFHENGEKISVIENCIDRHAAKNPNKTAFIFEDGGKIVKYTYKQLQVEVNKFANLLRENNVAENSRVVIFLPKIPEVVISFLGTIKHGSIPMPLFEAFQQEGLEFRLERGDANVLVTNTELSSRVAKDVHKKVLTLKSVFIVDSQEYKDKIKKCSSEFDNVLKNKEDTMTMIFTSSTAGTPVAGIQIPCYSIIQQYSTAKLVLDLKEDDVYWCTAHPGWVTGSIYGIIAPLLVGCTSYLYEGHFDAKKWIDIIKREKISVMYTAPTALRMLKPEVKKGDFDGVKNVCSVGEALPDTIFSFYKEIGIEINDTYWQTETGAMMICNWPGMKKKYGSLGKAIPGIEAEIKDGTIVFKPGWPAMMTGIYKHEKMYKDYFKNGLFHTNDLAKMDSEGYFFFEGRKDDMIKTSGERVSPLEIEAILLGHGAVKEAAVIGVPDELKGQVIEAFVVLNKNFNPSEELKQELSLFVKQKYAGHSYPKIIKFVPSLPKTNSGKIIRMKLREMKDK